MCLTSHHMPDFRQHRDFQQSFESFRKQISYRQLCHLFLSTNGTCPITRKKNGKIFLVVNIDMSRYIPAIIIKSKNGSGYAFRLSIVYFICCCFKYDFAVVNCDGLRRENGHKYCQPSMSPGKLCYRIHFLTIGRLYLNANL